MKKILPVRFGIIQKVILVLAVFAMSMVWPMGAFPVSHVSNCQWDGMRMSGASNETDFVRQEFSPNFEKLESVSVYVVNDPDSFDTMKAVLRVYDYTGTCLSENYFQLEDFELPGYVTIPVNLKLSPGILYFYTIGGVDGDMIVAYCGDEAKTAENGAFFYKEVPSGGTSIVTQYTYERPMGLKRILICDAAILFITAIFITLVGVARRTLFAKCSEERAKELWIRAEKIVRYSVVGVLAVGVIVAFVGIVIKKLFTDDILNIIVLFVGTVIAAGYAAYGVLTCKSELESLAEGEESLTTKIIHILRAILFAATILMCCMYLNGYSDYEKGLYLRKMLVAFGLFIVSLGKWRWIINIPNAVWSVVAAVIGKYYISLHSDHIEHINTATNSAWVIWVMGLLVIQILYRIIKGEWRKLKELSLPYFGLALVFWIGCIVFANGRTWPALLCVAMVVWIFFYTTSEDRSRILQDICNGILFAFVGTVIFCLYRRPYQYYMLTRYGGIFFTATATATYYLVPAAAALTKVLLALKEKNRRSLIFSSCIFGIITAYMGFTASRTGIVAMAVMVLFAFVVPVWRKKKTAWINQLKGFGILLVSVILTFVMTFSATRMLPAMVGNPFYFWYEQPNAYITPDTPWKGGEGLSETYIDIQKSLEMLFGRLFSVDAENGKPEANNQDYVLGPLLASAEPAGNIEVSETTLKYANGRLEIYHAYLSQLNLTGHDTMSALDDEGDPLMHAHNSYLQVAFDFGIPVGILFMILCCVIFLRGIFYAYRHGKAVIYEYLPLFLIVGFGVASIFEWVYHICNPLGFGFLVMFAPLMIKRTKNV